jgi:hypothetical protein
VEDEIVCLQRLWRPDAERGAEPTVALDALMGREGASQVDLFDAMQLEAVIKVCRQSKSLSDAGRKLYGMSRDAKSTPNDADRPVNPGGSARVASARPARQTSLLVGTRSRSCAKQPDNALSLWNLQTKKTR